MILSQIRGWSWSFPESQYIFQPRSINTNGWSAAAKNNLMKTNNMLSAFKLIWMHDGDWSILLNRVLREELATSLIRQLAHVAQLKAAEYPDGLSPSDTQWASDGSMIPAAGTILRKKSVTSSCVGAISCVFRVCGVAANIMHGEVMGLIASTILSASHPSHQQHPVSHHSDHLNVIWLINHAKNSQNVLLRLRRTNGRSYYRWLLNTLNPTTEISYVKAHTNDKSLPSLLNLVADHYTSTAQRHVNLVPIAPIPTFHMDTSTYHHKSLDWYEGNICTLTEQMLEENDAQTIAQGLNMHMLQVAYDPAPPPEYPYIRAISAYSAAVQLYARFGQLPVADILFR
ncbi:hypothetical protein V5O48_015001 [Marasmius crinis-equi]|uniref:TF-B3 domain-containing protein n=1 Tax=Marasmius crinis-equi TaxID=585013 RepID=A0ABR3EVP8_9AGAR